MATTTPYCYQANNAESYYQLAAEVANTSLNASFFPKLFTIVISPEEDDEAAFLKVGSFIDAQGLDFRINPIVLHDECRGALIDSEITPPCILHKIIDQMIEKQAFAAVELADTKDELKDTREKLGRYYQWWHEESDRRSQMLECIKALRTLLNSITE